MAEQIYTLRELRQTSASEFRVIATGNWHTSRNGKRVRETEGAVYIPTACGKFEETEWVRLAKAAIIREKGEALLQAVCDFCRQHCAWIRNEKDLERHAVHCISHGAYLVWESFKVP